MARRVLSPGNNGGLKATFSTSEKAYMYDASGLLIGSLSPTTDGEIVELSGTVEGEISQGQQLTLTYPQPAIDYTNQDGTYEGIGTNHNFQTASVSVSSITGGSFTTTYADFNAQQSITLFTFSVPVKQVLIFADGLVQRKAPDGTVTNGPIDVTLATPSKEVYVAISNSSGSRQTYTFVAEDANGNVYAGTKNATLNNGKFYKAGINLSNEAVYSGTQSDMIVVPDNGMIVLNEVKTDYGIKCEGSAHILFLGDNVVNGFEEEGDDSYYSHAGIEAGISGSDVVIRGLNGGSLTVKGAPLAAAIGSSCQDFGEVSLSCGNIIICGGTVDATGGDLAAGIGQGYYSSCGNITITSGITEVNATRGGDTSDPIGKWSDGDDNGNACGIIDISDDLEDDNGEYTRTIKQKTNP